MICRALISSSREEVMYTAEPGATGRGTMNVMSPFVLDNRRIVERKSPVFPPLSRVRKKEPVTGCR